MGVLEKGIIFFVICLVGFFIQDGHSQNSDKIGLDQEFYDTSNRVLQEYVSDNLLQNSTIVKDSIKTRLSGGWEDVLPPFYFARIIYDITINGEIMHMDSIYKVDFGTLASSPENAKLVKIFEMEYKPPKKITSNFGKEAGSYVYNNIQNIMCRQGFDKITKESTGESTCVTPKSVGKLVDRDWVKIDFLALQSLKNENYDSLRVPIIVTHVQPYENNLNYSLIYTTIWNLRNIPSDYSVTVFDPQGEEVKNCSTPTAVSPQKPHSVNEWKLFLNACGHQRILGNYTVIVSSESVNQKFVVTVDK